MNAQKRTTTDAIEIMHKLFYEGHPERIAALEQELINQAFGYQLFQLREKAGLSQEQLAEKVGTTTDIIDRIELNDFDDLPFSLLQTIVLSFGFHMDLRVVPTKQAEAKDQPAA